MPADRLTADCIWNSFRNSGKRHLILTGTKGSGKTSLLAKLFPDKLPGITTWAEPRKAVYLRDNISCETVQTGIFDDTIPGSENKMVLYGNGFADFGIPVLERCMEQDSPWITVDEIGYLEAGCSAYSGTLRRLFEKKQVAAVVRKQNLPFLQELCGRDDAFVVDLDDPFGNIGCVIMASGFGKRFGGNKLMADFQGRPLICRIFDVTENIFAKRVVVTRYKEIQQLSEKRGIPAILHDLPHRSDTVRLGLESLYGVDRCMFTPADQPLLRRETIVSLALASQNVPADFWRTIYEHTPGAPVVFPGWTFRELMALSEGNGGSVLLKKYPEQVRTVSVRDIYELRDVDSPEDLRDLSER